MIQQKNFSLRVLFQAFLIFWVCLAVSCTCRPCLKQYDPDPIPVSILFFNDIHGHLTSLETPTGTDPQKVGGVARMATLIKEIRKENDMHGIRTYVLIAGDILQGTPLSTVFKGEADIDCFNKMGVDAMCVGNHEFDFGMDNFMALQKQAAFPFLSANIVEKDTWRRLCKPAFFVQLPYDITLTVIGVMTPELLTVTKPENVAGLQVLDPVQAVGEVFEQVKALGPVVLLSHCGAKIDGAIAEAHPDLSAIIGGHDHILLSPPREITGVPILQALEKGEYLGRIDLLVSPGELKAEMLFSNYIPVTADLDPDPEIEAIVSSYAARFNGQFRAVIGESLQFLDGNRKKVRYEETALGNFITDIMRENTGADIALINGGAIRSSINKGDVTVEDIFKVMPFANEIILVKLTGIELLDILERSVRGRFEDEYGGFLQVSGIFFDIRGHDVENVTVGEKKIPLSPKTVYTIAVPDFLASGGDGYTQFVDHEKMNTRLPLRELIVDTIRERGVISAQTEGRIRRIQ